MANYLVTGAAGFIGYRAAELLIQDGHSVVGIDNLCDAYDVRLKDWRLARLNKLTGFEFHLLDVEDRHGLDKIFDSHKRFDGVINLAARAGVRQSVVNPWVYVDTNVTGTLNLLEMSRKYDVPKFVLASTSSLYGANPPLPTPEDADSDHPLQAYAASKKGAEALCHAYHHLYGLDVTIFRYFTVYGPAGRPDMVMFRFAQWIAEGRPVQITGNGHQSRGFTYLDDIARGTILGLKPLGYELINLGGHEVVDMIKLVTMIEELTGRKAKVEFIPAHPADVQANWANVEKAKKLLGWVPRVELKEGVKNLVDWYLEERDWAKDVLTP